MTVSPSPFTTFLRTHNSPWGTIVPSVSRTLTVPAVVDVFASMMPIGRYS
jgi:hypothetical protein